MVNVECVMRKCLLIGVYYPKAGKITLPVIMMKKMHSSLRDMVEEQDYY